MAQPAIAANAAICTTLGTGIYVSVWGAGAADSAAFLFDSLPICRPVFEPAENQRAERNTFALCLCLCRVIERRRDAINGQHHAAFRAWGEVTAVLTFFRHLLSRHIARERALTHGAFPPRQQRLTHTGHPR